MQGPPGEICAALPALEELDLTGSLLPSWGALTGILQELPQLRLLDLSANRLRVPPSVGSAAGGATFSGLRTLILNHCAINWNQVGIDIPIISNTLQDNG